MATFCMLKSPLGLARDISRRGRFKPGYEPARPERNTLLGALAYGRALARSNARSNVMRSCKIPLLLASVCGLVALAGCETVAEEATEAIGFEYTAILAPVGGGAGSGKAEISLNDATNMLCTDLELSNGVNMTAGAILGPGNTPVADIDVPDDNDSDDCDNVTDAQIDGVKANPGAYRVQVNATTGNLSGPLVKEG